MKTLEITTSHKARKLQVESLFKPVNGATLSSGRYDMGKYKVAPYIGRQLEVADHVHALWMERRKDSDGEYHALFCLTSRQ
jgi:hypothetical protein